MAKKSEKLAEKDQSNQPKAKQAKAAPKQVAAKSVKKRKPNPTAKKVEDKRSTFEKNKDSVFIRTKELASEQGVFFITDICKLLPISVDTYYRYFPKESEDYKVIRDMLNKKRMNVKVKLRKRWENGTERQQERIMRLLASNEERVKMFKEVTATDLTTQGKAITEDLTMSQAQVDALINSLINSKDFNENGG